MVRIAAVLLLGLAVAVPAASSRSAVDWKKLDYFDFASQQLVVATDRTWNRAVVPKDAPPTLPVPGPGLRETTPRWIWDARCASGAEFVSFTKTIFAPGDPYEGYLDFTFGQGRDLPFKRAEFLVNGTEIGELKARTGKTKGFAVEFHDRLAARALKAFRYGENTLTIRAARGALPKGQPCNTRNRFIGVVADLRLRFLPDLVAAPSPAGETQVATQFGGYTGTAIFTNRGPSGSAGGTFVFGWSSQNVEIVAGAASISGGVRNCRSNDDGKVYGTVECEYRDFPVGKVVSVGIRMIVRQPANWSPRSTGDVSHTWSIRPAGGDIKGANNDGSHRIIICGPQATDPRCKKK